MMIPISTNQNELADAAFPHPHPRLGGEHAERDGPVEQRPVAVAEAVDGDAVFAVQAHAQIGDREPEGHPDDALRRCWWRGRCPG